MGPGEFGAAWLLLAATVGACSWTAGVLVRRALPGEPLTVRLVAFGIAGTVALVAAHVLPLGFGVLSREAALVTAVVLAVGVFPLRRAPGSADRLPDRDDDHRAAHLVAAAAVVVSLGWLLAFLRMRAAAAVTHDDAMVFHLPVVARWIQEGTLWQTIEYAPHFANGAYPHTGDVLTLAAVLPFVQDFLVRFVFLPWIAMAVLAMGCLARELGARRSSALLSGLAVTAVPILLYASVEAALPDVVLVAAFAGGTLFLLRHHRTGAHADLALAAAGLGLVLGTKWYGPPAVAALLAVWLVWRVIAERALAVPLRHAVYLGTGAALVGGVWMVRNYVLTGNPVFPKRVSVLGTTVFDAPPTPLRDSVSFTVAHYLPDSRVLTHVLLPDWWAAFGPTGLLLALSVVVALVLRVVARRLVDPRVTLLAVAAIVLAVVYVFTPDSAAGYEGDPILVRNNARYALPALVAASAVMAWLAGRVPPRAGTALDCVLAAAVVYGLWRSIPVSAGVWAAGASTVAAVVVVVAGGRGAAARVALGRVPGRPLVAAACGVTAFVAVGGIAYELQTRHVEGRYVGPPASEATRWINEHMPSGARIGLAGERRPGGLSPIYPAFGPRLGNRVRFVGRFDRHLLQPFERAADFQADLRARPVDALMVYRPASGPSPVEGWAMAAGFRRVIDGSPIALLVGPGARGRR